jgi:hypothetical protein
MVSRLSLIIVAIMACLGVLGAAEAQRPPPSSTAPQQVQTPAGPGVTHRASFPAQREMQCQRAGEASNDAVCAPQGPATCPSTVLFRTGQSGPYQRCAAACQLQTSAASSAASCQCVINSSTCSPVTPRRP